MGFGRIRHARRGLAVENPGFVEPAFAWKATPTVLAAFGFFSLVCAVAIVVITGLTGALRDVSRELGRAEAVADSHAGLFRELNERMTHHMRTPTMSAIRPAPASQRRWSRR